MDIIANQLLPTLAAVVLGGIIGFERQWSGHSAGLRTHMLVSLSAAVFILASQRLAPPSMVDVTRVVQGIAAGVGFIGAGAILKSGKDYEVLGLTSAATIWLAAAMGTACGLREYSLATISAALATIVLLTLRRLEDRFGKAARKATAKHDRESSGGSPG
jgi:putative Mg2+ transporter-C (MgtC) family protein